MSGPKFCPDCRREFDARGSDGYECSRCRRTWKLEDLASRENERLRAIKQPDEGIVYQANPLWPVLRKLKDIDAELMERRAPDAARFAASALGAFLEAGETRAADVVAPIVAAGITEVAGEPGAGKTLLALEAAATKASGVSRIGFTAEPGKVLFIGADMSEEMYRDYLSMLMFPGREAALDNLHIAIAPGLLLDNEEGTQEFFDLVHSVEPELVVMDYFANFLSGDGFTNKELRPVLEALRMLRDADGIAVLMLDQTRKAGNGPAPLVPAVDQLYGGRAKSAIADRIVFIKKDPASGTFMLKGAKERGGGFADLTLDFDAEGGWERLEGPPLHLTPAESTVAACIDAAPEKEGRTVNELCALTHMAERVIRRAIAKLTYERRIVEGKQRARAKTYRAAPLIHDNDHLSLTRVTEGDNEGDNVSALSGDRVTHPLIEGGVTQPVGRVSRNGTHPVEATEEATA